MGFKKDVWLVIKDKCSKLGLQVEREDENSGVKGYKCWRLLIL